jgi:hypothetical protein
MLKARMFRFAANRKNLSKARAVSQHLYLKYLFLFWGCLLKACMPTETGGFGIVKSA